MTGDEIVDKVYKLLTLFGNPLQNNMSLAQDPYRGDLYKIFIAAAQSGCTKHSSQNFMGADGLVDELIARGIPPTLSNLELIAHNWRAWSYYYNRQNP